MLCVSGKFIAVELKKDEESEPTQLQLYTLDRIKLCGGLGLVAYPENWDLIYKLIKLYAEGKRK